MTTSTRACMMFVMAPWTLVAAVAGGDPVAVEKIAMEGDPVPGMGGFGYFSLNMPFTDGNGKVGFTGSAQDMITDGGATEHFVFYDTAVVFRDESVLPIVLSGAESTMGVSNAGGFIYSPSTDGNDSVWTQKGLLLVKGDPAPGYPGQQITFTSRPQMTPDGDASFVAGIAPDTSTDDEVLYRGPGEEYTTIVATGDVIGAFVIEDLDFDYQFSDDGAHFIMPITTGGAAATDQFLLIDGVLGPREGSPTGQGDNWSAFDNVSINDAGDYLFTGDTDGDVASDEFIALNGAIIVREGDVVGGVTLTPSATLRAASLNNLGQIAHAWGIGTGEEVLFVGDATDLASSSIPLLKTGDTIDWDDDGRPDATVVDFNASNVIGSGLNLAEDGRVFLEVDVTSLAAPGMDYEAIIAIDFDPSCPPDLDGTGDVGFPDLVQLLADWGPCRGCPEDLDGNGDVGFPDLVELLASWGPC